jgi:hypothetical protein
MKHLFVSQSLYQPKGSQEDIARMRDVTDRLTDPTRYPKAARLKQEEMRRERETKLAARSSQSFGSINSIGLSDSVSSLSQKTPAIFHRLSNQEYVKLVSPHLLTSH